MPEGRQSLSLSHLGHYKFLIDFGTGPALRSDEPKPIGEGEGPSPEQLLAAGVANCLCASLYFALTKYRQTADGLKADVTVSTARNERGRLRIERINVAIALADGNFSDDLLNRALGQFEDFCTVSESVKRGVPVEVSISDGSGNVLTHRPESKTAAAPRPPASSPEELVRLFAERANAGDVEGLVDLYEPGATLAAGERQSHGEAGIHEFYKSLLERKKEFSGAEVVQKLAGDDLAVTVARAPNGGLSLEVARRQADGSWRWVIDQLKLKLPD
jgi:uncharacterized OsmC-like protein/ketosteroid isomerase-like protein